MKNRIESIQLVRVVDDSPDTSCIGEFTDECSEWAIERRSGQFVHDLERDGEWEMPERGREYRFFIPYAGGEKPGSKTYRKYGKADHERMESLNNGNWCYIGIRAEATIHVPYGACWGLKNHFAIQHITSGGLWGIESDSDESYFAEVGKEELADLAAQLESLGFSKRAIKAATPKEMELIDS